MIFVSEVQVMHGADRDIEWLQRDFGIYVCNMFDTGQVCHLYILTYHVDEYKFNSKSIWLMFLKGFKGWAVHLTFEFFTEEGSL